MVVVWLKKRRQKANHIGGARFRFPSLYESLDSSKSSSSFSYFYSKFFLIHPFQTGKKKLLAGTSLMGRRGVQPPLYGSDGQETADRFGPSTLLLFSFSRAKKEEETERLRSPARNLRSGCCSIDSNVFHFLMRAAQCAALFHISRAQQLVARRSKCIGSRSVWSMTRWQKCTSSNLNLVF